LTRASASSWRAYLPDFPGCRAEDESASAAVQRATEFASRLLRDLDTLGQAWPAARSFDEVRADGAWASEHGSDWATAIVRHVSFGPQKKHGQAR
jgi:predicted RNase H-like HicB family nuclease